MLRNHGLLTVGKSIADAFLNMYIFENTCRIQIDAQAGGELVYVNPQILQGVAAAVKTVTVGQGANLAWPALAAQARPPGPDVQDLNPRGCGTICRTACSALRRSCRPPKPRRRCPPPA